MLITSTNNAHDNKMRGDVRYGLDLTLSSKNESKIILSLVVRSPDDKWQDAKLAKADLEAFARLDEDRYQRPNEIGPLTGPHAPRAPLWPCK